MEFTNPPMPSIVILHQWIGATIALTVMFCVSHVFVRYVPKRGVYLVLVSIVVPAIGFGIIRYFERYSHPDVMEYRRTLVEFQQKRNQIHKLKRQAYLIQEQKRHEEMEEIFQKLLADHGLS